MHDRASELNRMHANTCHVSPAAVTLSPAVCGRRHESKPSGDGESREGGSADSVCSSDTLGIVGLGNLRGSARARNNGTEPERSRSRGVKPMDDVKTRVCHCHPRRGGQPKLKSGGVESVGRSAAEHKSQWALAERAAILV
jgi:hypothetical protein